MNIEARAVLEILIKEVQEVLKEDGESRVLMVANLEALLQSWVKANDLHPENVITIDVAKIPDDYITIGKGLVAKKERDGSILIAEIEEKEK